MNSGYFAETIKTVVKMPELLKYYGFNAKNNRIACPIHGGKNDNLGIKKEYCHCFKCGYTADVIKFVQDYFSLSFFDALEKINHDFCIGLPIRDKINRRQKIDMARQSFQKKQEHKNKESQHEKLLTEWENAHAEFIRLERQKNNHKPQNDFEELQPEFIEAITNIELAKYRLDCAEEELIRYEKIND